MTYEVKNLAKRVFLQLRRHRVLLCGRLSGEKAPAGRRRGHTETREPVEKPAMQNPKQAVE